jgi:hypothetical protein
VDILELVNRRDMQRRGGSGRPVKKSLQQQTATAESAAAVVGATSAEVAVAVRATAAAVVAAESAAAAVAAERAAAAVAAERAAAEISDALLIVMSAVQS